MSKKFLARKKEETLRTQPQKTRLDAKFRYLYDKMAEWFIIFSANANPLGRFPDVLFDTAIIAGLLCGIWGTRFYNRLTKN
jgi:hypothetical protein